MIRPLVHGACDHLASAVRVVVVVLAVAMLAALSLQVVMRYVFERPQSWTEELAVTLFSWSMLLAIGAGVRDAIHVRMDLLADLLPGPLQVLLARLVAFAIAFTGVFIAWSGVRYAGEAGDISSAAMGYPMTLLYASAPVCGALIAVFGLEHALLGGPPRPEPALPAA